MDDDVDTCRNLSDILTDLGYRVDTAHDGLHRLGAGAEKHLRRRPARLEDAGHGRAGTVPRDQEAAAGTVAIVVTAYAEQRHAEEALAAGAWQVLPKPVDFPKLLALVDEALGQPLVMVVDDDPDLCANLWDLLRDRGYRVCLAHDEQEAAAAAQGPGLQGRADRHEAARRRRRHGVPLVRETNPQARTVVITGHRSEMDQLIQQVVDEGADAVCYKPFDVAASVEHPAAAWPSDSNPDARFRCASRQSLTQVSLMAAVSPLHVLVVDDDADTRANLCDVLELDDYQSKRPARQREALDRAKLGSIDAIILDRRLPDGNAEELLPRLRQLAPEAAVIIVTGYADLEGAIAAIRQGAADYLLKPINPDLLRARLAGIAERKRAEERSSDSTRTSNAA